MKKSKFQKKKQREKEVRKKILNQHEVERKKISAVRKIIRKERKKIAPITRENFEKAKKLQALQIDLQLEHNMKILEALQAAEDSEKGISGLESMTGLEVEE